MRGRADRWRVVRRTQVDRWASVHGNGWAENVTFSTIHILDRGGMVVKLEEHGNLIAAAPRLRDALERLLKGRTPSTVLEGIAALKAAARKER